MICTVTFNPAVDLVVDIAEIKPGEVNRLSGEQVFFGGKGINVSLVLNELGIPTKALGFRAGFTGAAIEQYLREKGVVTDMIELPAGFSRINVKIRSEKETELNGSGSDIDENALAKLFSRLEELSASDTLVLAGSVPKSVPADIYEQILRAVSGRGVRTAVDACGELLMNVLEYKPFVVKPNIHELGELFGKELRSADEAAVYAAKLRGLGAVNVLVSMGGDGALLIDGNGEEHRCGVCRGTLRNSVGAGDSMLAGFLAGCESGDYGYALKLGTAAGGATAFSDGLGSKETIDRLFAEL